MRKTLATLALAAIPVLILSACNGSAAGGGPGVAPLPNSPATTHSHRAHRADNGPQDLHAGGATFPAYAYNLENQPVGLYNSAQAPPGQGSLFYSYGGVGTIYYCLTGSGFGRKDFTGQSITSTAACAGLGDNPTGFGGRSDPLDFVGSDVAMTSATDCCGASTYYAMDRASTYGQPFEIPTIGGPIVFGFRPQDFSANTKTIKLSTWTYCAIANGTVGNWNDPAITADNGKSVTGGASESITFYFRSDGSGTSYLFQNKLNNSTSGCNQTFGAPYNAPPYASASRSAAWTYGTNQNLEWLGPQGVQASGSDFIGQSGNPGVLAGIQSTPFATGYVEGAYAKAANPKVGQAYLQNGYSKKKGATFVSPENKKAVKNALAHVVAGNITYGMGSDGNPLGSSTPWCQLYVDPSNFVSPPAKSYPIVGFSYWLFYGNNSSRPTSHTADLKTLVNYIVSSQANTIVTNVEYAPLSNSLHNAITSALNGNGGSQPACLQ
jgi:ABC-type phosphate transport system substrate-binding protein